MIAGGILRSEAFAVAGLTARNALAGEDVDMDGASNFTTQQLTAMKIVSLCLGSMSVASAMLAFYWFVRMRRNFRHDLIMLLIQSDMFKSLWFAIYPIVTFVHGPVKSSSAFCQISGFFIAAGIEASDIAVLLIALHTGLNIFLPRQTGGELGLFPYRRTAYLVWAIVPLVLASLAFIRKPYGYVSDGRLCYLPGQPEWPGLALSWVPRYIIFATIIFTYGYIYYYVTLLIRRFGKLSETRTEGEGQQAQSRGTWRTGAQRFTEPVPPVPPIEYHGLIPPSPPSRRASMLSAMFNPSSRRSSGRSNGKNGNARGGPGAARPVEGNLLARAGAKIAGTQPKGLWKWPIFGSDDTNPSPQREQVSPSPDADHSPSRPSPDATLDGASSSSSSSPTPAEPAGREFLTVPDATHPPPSRRSSSATITSQLPQDLSSPTPSSEPTAQEPCEPPAAANGVSLMSMLRHGSHGSRSRSQSRPGSRPTQHPAHSPSTASLSDFDGAVVFLSPSAYDVSGLAKTREKIRRQLRLLFVYPLVYMLFWIAPLVSHVFKWHNATDLVPFPLSLLSLGSLCAQGAVNAWLFSTREQPWKHRRSKRYSSRRGSGAGASTAGSHGGNNAHKRRSARFGEWGWPGTLERGYPAGPGRTREEMMSDERMARRRRLEEEFMERNIDVNRARAKRPVRDWWDVEEERAMASLEMEDAEDRNDDHDFV